MADEWRLFWVGDGDTPSDDGRAAGWADLTERERALGLRERQPILVSPEGRVDPRLSECFRRSAFSAKAQGTQVTYAPLYRLFFTFLWQRGLNWDQATEDDVEDWEDWRRRRAENPVPVGGGTWAKELAALKLLYDIAAKRGFVPANPVTLPPPSDVKTSDVKWLSPRAFRLWRNVGLGGMLPSRLEDDRWRGRCAGRDTAYADLLYSSGLRRREGGTLLTFELPVLGQRNYYAGKVGQAVAKRAGYTFYVGHPALQRIEGYRVSTRALAVARAQARGVYERLPGLRVVREVTRAGRVRWTDRGGRAGESALGRLTAAERMRLFVDGEDGLEPAMLWLSETGLPLQYTSWTKVFERASDRCAALGFEVFATPKMLRHSMALRMLISLHNALDRRLGLTPAQRLHYEEVYGQVWLMVKDLLGHRSEQVTRDVYLEPVRGLQLESLLGDEENPVDAGRIAELSARTGLILDAA
ncbi:integrase [Streptomyces sp. RLB3-17]|uniref:site-specific integrase n=1 Tax=Streptomyces sp. RLB3-17 TaxID=2594455 RepID=UPI00116580E7|nr:site-specific integrase [Streptomyces sp. RLB3-17]QDO45840.1 integrase [Streptomyces sp. RLB3-17]